jgi:hypothetical protein
VEGGSRWSAKGFEELTEMMSDAPTVTGRSMVCQGLRRIPSPIPTGNFFFMYILYQCKNNTRTKKTYSIGKLEN